MRRLLLVAVLVFTSGSVSAQVSDDFSDGDFLTNPSWTGDTGLWKVDTLEANLALQSDGQAQSDTLFLSTPSAVSVGTWSFRFAHREANLSNFNGARIYLVADSDQLRGPIQGYFVQIGTNNSDEVRLYRQDGDPASRRVLIGQSSEPIFAGDANSSLIVVSRTDDLEWTVSVDGAELFSVRDTTYVTSHSFGVWIKHTQSTAQSYYFDDIEVEGETGPPDTTPPFPLSAVFQREENAIVITFSEPIDQASLLPTSFSLSTLGQPNTVEPSTTLPEVVQITYATPIPTGIYTLTLENLRDLAGNVIPAGTSIEVDVVNDTSPPVLLAAQSLDANRIEVAFDEPVLACDTERFLVTPDIGIPASFTSCNPDGQSTFELELVQSLRNGETYTLSVNGIEDLYGNILESASSTFTFVDPNATPPPGPREIVINEIYFDPPDTELEFIELFNRTNSLFDLSLLGLADNRRQSVPIVSEPTLLDPNGYAILVRDGTAFSQQFPGVPFLEVSSWPALNNSGDTPILFHGETVIDSVAYLSSWGGNDVSLERKDPNGPSNNRFNFGSATSSEGATPGARNSIYEPDTTPPLPLFAEQVEPDVLALHFNEPVVTANTSSFSLANGDHPAQVLQRQEGVELQLRFSNQLNGIALTISDVADLSGNSLSSFEIPISYVALPGELVINEIMFDPLADRFDERPDQPEYVELYNTGARYLTLRNHYWTDVPDEDGATNTIAFGDGFFSVGPESFAVVYADPDAATSASADSKIEKAYPVSDFSQVSLIPIDRTTLSLTNSSDLITLRLPFAVVLDSVRYDAQWHHPNLVDATGVSLERITPTGPSDTQSNWSSSVSSLGGTPGSTNSIFLSQQAELPNQGLTIHPSPFSPDSDGFDDTTAITYSLSSAASLIRARIYDARGRLVRTLEQAALAGHTGQLLWDGLDDERRALRIGIYVVLLEAIDTQGGSVEAHKGTVVLARHLN